MYNFVDIYCLLFFTWPLGLDLFLSLCNRMNFFFQFSISPFSLLYILSYYFLVLWKITCIILLIQSKEDCNCCDNARSLKQFKFIYSLLIFAKFYINLRVHVSFLLLFIPSIISNVFPPIYASIPLHGLYILLFPPGIM